MHVVSDAMVLIVFVKIVFVMELKDAMKNVHQEHFPFVNGVSIYSYFVLKLRI